jgi:hypothetical protein
MNTRTKRVSGTDLLSTINTTDAMPRNRRYRSTADAILEAIAIGKIINGGEIWDGLQRRSDSQVEVAEATAQLLTQLSASPFAAGNILTAEQIGRVIDLGRAYTELLRGVCDKLKAAKDAPMDPEECRSDEEKHAAARSQDAATRAQIRTPRLTGHFSTPLSPADINAANGAHWDKAKHQDAIAREAESRASAGRKMQEAADRARKAG